MINQIGKTEAIKSLAPNARWTLQGDTLEWADNVETQPTEAEISNEVTRLQAEYDSLEYARLRKAEYNLLNQDELRFDDLMNGTTTWKDTILAIKAKYPKETI